MSLRSHTVSLAYPNWIDSATLAPAAGTEFTSALPLNNAKNRVLAKKARTQGTNRLTPGIELTFADKPRQVACVALAAHNLTVTATIRVRVYSEDSFTTLLYDSGEVDVWPEMIPSELLEWEDDEFWLGKISNENRDFYTPLYVLFLPQMWPVQGIKIDIEDPGNTDDFVQFGRIFVSDVFQPSKNALYGPELGFDDPTEIETSQDDTEYFDVHRQKRYARVAFDGLNEADETRLTIMRRRLGISGEMIFAMEIDPSIKFYERTFLGRLRETSPLSQPYFSTYAHGIDVSEII